MSYGRSPGEEIEHILSALEADEVATFQWLIGEIRDRFGVSDRFDPQDPAFHELAKHLASKVL